MTGPGLAPEAENGTIEKSFALPDLGEGLADAEILRWLVAVGDPVTLNQVIAEVETAKAAVELPSPYAGTVLSLRVSEGETVAVGTTIITFAVPADPSTVPADPSRAAAESAAPSAVAEERIPVLVGYGATSGTSSRRNGRARPAPPRQPSEAGSVRSAAPSPAAFPAGEQPERPPVRAPELARPLAKPLVRKLARDLGLDLRTVTGSGVGGVITRQDVLDQAATPHPTSPPPPAPATGPLDRPSRLFDLPSDRPLDRREERIPIRGIRKATAAAMVASAFTAPHVTEFLTVDVTATMDLLRRLRASAFLGGVKLTMTAFVATAMIQGLRRFPELNSSWDEAAQEIVLKHYVNLGVATATPRGLLVPNLKSADRLDLIAMARALEALTETAREGRASPADLTGGTISLTNVGVFGVDSGTPILNPGEAAILCLGAVREQPWVHEGALAVRWVTTLSLSFDHRLVDGEQGSRYLADIAATLATG